MYEAHPHVNTPPLEARLWRYMDLAKYLWLLQCRSLYFCRLDELGDDFEGSHTKPNVQRVVRTLTEANRPPETIQTSRNSIAAVSQQVRRCTFVSCWHMSDSESDVMWRLYAGEAGVAVATTVERLISALDTEVPIYIGSIEYIDYEKDLFGDTRMLPEGQLLAGNLFLPVFHKRLFFKEDNEVRAIIARLPVGENADGPAPEGLAIKASLEDLIESVYVSPLRPPWFHQVVAEVLKIYGIRASVLPSRMTQQPSF
ncbi:MAG: DUF2971 domain-containing protein [Sulfobacillus sp.]